MQLQWKGCPQGVKIGCWAEKKILAITVVDGPLKDTAHTWIHSISVVLKFHGGAMIEMKI